MNRIPEPFLVIGGCIAAVLLICTCTVTAVTCDGPPESQAFSIQIDGCNQSPASVPCSNSFHFPALPSPGGDPATQYYLDFGDGQPPYYGFNDFTSHTYDYPGTYVLKYRAGTACDRWIEGIYTLVVPQPENYTPVLHGCAATLPEAGFTGAPLSGVAPLTVQFTSTSTGANAWHWDFGDGTSSPAQNPRHTYMTAGLYSVTLEARDICTNAVSTASMSHYITITVQSGTLAITTVPEKANVFVDNVFRGVTPLTLPDTPSGIHMLRLTLPGYEDYLKSITVEPRKTVLVEVDLTSSTPNATTTGASLTPTIPPPQNGSVAVTSVPDGASVTLDGLYKGTTPVIITDVLPGNHNISIISHGYKPWDRSVAVGSGDTSAVNANLLVLTKPVVNTGSLTVITDPSGARVRVDGDLKGVSPATIPGLSAGPHVLELQLEEYHDLSTTVSIIAGENQNYTTGLQKVFSPPVFEVILTGLVILIVIGAGFYRLTRNDEA